MMHFTDEMAWLSLIIAYSYEQQSTKIFVPVLVKSGSLSSSFLFFLGGSSASLSTQFSLSL